MEKIVRLTESDLTRLVRKVLKEVDMKEMMDVSSDSDYYQMRKRIIKIPFNEVSRLYHLASRFCEGKDRLPDCMEIEDVAREYNLKF